MNPYKSNLLITGCVRNASKNIKYEIDKLKQITYFFKSIKILLIESDSQDNTNEILKKIKSKDLNFDFKSLGNLRKKYKFRTDRIARCRNEYVHEITSNSKYKNIDLVLIVDLDNINFLLSKKSLLSCFKQKNWDAVFANQKFAYYDIYALRHEEWSPNDYRNQLNFFDKYRKNRFLNYWFTSYSKMLIIPEDSEWIEVDSAFGGAAFYKKKCFFNNRYSGSINGKEICEHVFFNKYLKLQKKKLFICPSFINSGFNEHHKRLTFFYKLKFIFILFINLFKKN